MWTVELSRISSYGTKAFSKVSVSILLSRIKGSALAATHQARPNFGHGIRPLSSGVRHCCRSRR